MQQNWKRELPQLVQQELTQVGVNYGDSPVISKIDFWGSEARLIEGSANGQVYYTTPAALIVRYTSPVLVNGQYFEYLLLRANLRAITALARTLEFKAPELSLVSVYFSNNLLEPADVCAKVFEQKRNVIRSPNLFKDTLAQLLHGPSENEQAAGFFSNLPKTAQLLELKIEGTRALVRLSGAFGDDQCQYEGAVEQVKQTLLQFSEIKSVSVPLLTK